MQKKITRREMVKSVTGFTIGAGVASLSFNSSLLSEPISQTGNHVNVKVSPPGPKSLSLLKDIKKYSLINV